MSLRANGFSAIRFSASPADEAFDQLMNAMMGGAIMLGEPISERLVARRLRVSVSGLRQALTRLEACGLAERLPDGNARACKLSSREVRELFEIRGALETMACGIAAAAMSDGEIDALGALLGRHGRLLEERSRSDAGYPDRLTGDDFHFHVIRGSRNSSLTRLLLGELYYRIRLYRGRSAASPGRAEAAYAEHLDILAALRARDSARAEAAMQRHIANAHNNLVRIGDAEQMVTQRDDRDRNRA